MRSPMLSKSTIMWVLQISVISLYFSLLKKISFISIFKIDHLKNTKKYTFVNAMIFLKLYKGFLFPDDKNFFVYESIQCEMCFITMIN